MHKTYLVWRSELLFFFPFSSGLGIFIVIFPFFASFFVLVITPFLFWPISFFSLAQSTQISFFFFSFFPSISNSATLSLCFFNVFLSRLRKWICKMAAIFQSSFRGKLSCLPNVLRHLRNERTASAAADDTTQPNKMTTAIFWNWGRPKKDPLYYVLH